MEPILFEYIILYADGEVGTLKIPVTMMDAVAHAHGHELEDDAVQDRIYLKSFTHTGSILWVGHRGINLGEVIVAFPIIPDKHLENPEAFRLLGAQLAEDEFSPLMISLEVNRQTMTLPAYGPTEGRNPFNIDQGCIEGFIDIQGALVNTARVRDILVIATTAKTWADTRKLWNARTSQTEQSSSE